MPPWTSHEPQNIDDTQYNTLCWSCHNDVDAPYVRTHSSLQIDDSYGDWTVECRVCHNPHYQKQKEYGSASYLYSGTSTTVTATTITKTGADWETDTYEGMVVIPNISQNKYVYEITGNTSDTLTVHGPMDLTKVTTGNTFAILYGNLINKAIDLSKIIIDPSKSGSKTVRFFRREGANSFADGNSTYDGVCEVCHTRTTHFRNGTYTGDSTYSDPLHTNVGSPAGTYCIECHSHVNGFAHGGSGGTGCDECHGHDAGYGGKTGGKGTYVAHSTHTENDTDDKRGPNVGCGTCHNTSSFPNFADGVSYADYKAGTEMTTVCNPCHSPDGTYNGVSDSAIGAKNNWSASKSADSRVYEANGSLKAGKGKWCATCHDESPSQIQSVNAPNVVGDEDGSFTYGTGWGFYKTGHGLPSSQTYPASGGVTDGAGKGCLDCHDSTVAHIDGNVRTFDDHESSATDPSEYRQGYRLKLIGGLEPMMIPKLGGTDSSKYRLCLSCHTEGPFINSGDLNTNYRNGTTNLHYYHLNINDTMRFKADWGSGGSYDSQAYTSRITCVICHNVHGSTRLVMIRDGKLVNREPGIKIWYYNSDISTNSNPPQPENLPLSASTGSLWLPGSAGNVCYACHGGTSTEIKTRNPFQDVTQAPILSWTGETNYTSDGVDPNGGASGTVLTFRVKYTDTNNDSPSYIQVWVDEDDSGTYEQEEKYNMTSVSASDIIYTDGKLYYKTISIDGAGDNIINYRFYASDGTNDATGTPTSGGTITISGSAPVLSWTGEAGYISDGVNPDTGGNGAGFEFRVKYTDADNNAPASIQVWLDEDDSGTYEEGEKYTMTAVTAGDTTYSDGKLYTKGLSIAYAGDGSLNYLFYASDGVAEATGSPTSNNTVIVISSANNPPSLDWVAATCLTNGVKPAEGPNGGTFEFQINYTDEDNQCPPSANDIQVWIDENDSGSYDEGEKYNLAETDASDTTCSDGKLYKVTRTLSLAGDNAFNYRFYASDGTNTATGDPIANSTVKVVDALKVRPSGGSGWYSTIQSAVDAIDGAHTVLVYEGTYNEQVSFSGGNDNDTTVRSVCGPDTTIIDATGKTYGVSVGSNCTGSTVKGFQITKATTGVFVNNAGITIDNCKIHNNATLGISFIDDTDPKNTPLIVKDSELYDNNGGSGGAIWIKNGSDPHHQIINTVIHDNTSVSGGGVFLGGIVDITSSTIRDNSATANGGGLYISGTVSLYKSLVIGNTAVGNGGGVFMPDGDTFTMENSVMADNTAAIGGGAWVDGTLTAVNSTIASNEAIGSSGGGAFYTNTWAHIDIKNSIVWNNFASNAMQKHVAYVSSTSTMTVDDSIVSNDGDGIYNDYPYVVVASGGSASFSGYLSEQDPFFVDASGRDYHIRSNSPTIDVANATYAPADDIDGDSRPQGSADDIGADEYEGTTNNAPVLSWTGEASYESDGVNPNSSVGGSNFEFRINYTDADNTAPTSIQVWVDEDDSGSYDEDEKYKMTAVNTDTVYADGKLYTKTLSLSYAGNGALNYRFYASDGTVAATGAPASDRTVTVINSAPALSWTEETNYESDGVDPNSGLGGSNFEFRIDYSDDDNTAPSYVEVWVDENDSGAYDLDEKYSMTEADGGDTDYTDGKRYSKILTLTTAGDGVLNYKFAASDGTDPATGTPTNNSELTVSGVTVTFTSASQSSAGESGTATITAQLSAISGQDVTVPFTVNVVSTATGGGTDYSITASPITITAGNTTADITITIATDSLDENNETVIVDMGIPTNAAQGAITTHSLTITDDDASPTVTFTSASQSTTDESGTAAITAQLSAVSGRDVTVPFTINGSSTATGGGTDYSITASPITITAGNTTADITVTIATDNLDENNETIIVDMGTPTNATQGATTTHTVTITDDDAEPTVTFTSESQSTAGESGTATITVQLSGVSGRNVTVPFTVNVGSTATGGGTDYSITVSPITITAGNTTADITVTVATDSLDENNETVIVDMGTPTNATQGVSTTHTLTITDDDLTPTVTFTSASQATTGESGTATITAQLSAASGKNVTVPFTVNVASTADNPDDYTITESPITITAGNTTANITVTITTDTDVEGNETVIVNMGSPTNATQGAITTHTLTITDDDTGGATYTVCKATHADNPCNYQSINAGIDDAAVVDGDTLLVSDDTYSENINFDGKDIKIQSKLGAALTIIQGSGLSSNAPVVTFSNAETSGAILDGFTIDNQATASTLTRGISISGGSAPTIKNCFVEGNAMSGGQNGAGIYINGGTATIQNTNIGGDAANKNSCQSGCGLYATTISGPLSITNSIVSENTGTGVGAGIWLVSNGAYATTITDTTFTNNTATLSGGAIYNNASILSISGSTSFTSNTAGVNQNGGAVYNTGAGASVTIDGSTFTTNSCGNLGGAIYMTGSTAATPLSISNSTFTGNTATAYGGAIALATITNATNISSTTISGSSTSNNKGGGIYLSAAPLTLTDTNVDNNTAGLEGGGIYATGATSVVNITGGSVSGNSGTAGGGIFLTTSATLTATNVTISNNTATSTSGGGIYSSTLVTITNGTFEGNTAATIGGGIYAQLGFSITGSTFTGNQGTTGGAIHNLGATGNFYGANTFTSNIATGSGGNAGGAIYSNGRVININDAGSVFSGNYGTGSGGAIWVSAALNISGATTFDGNGSSAVTSGGAIISQGGTINDTTFTNNRAAGNGGALYFVSTAGTVNRSTFSGNYLTAASYGGAFYSNVTGSNFNNCTFYNNSAGPGGTGTGGAIYQSLGGANINYSTFYDNKATTAPAIRFNSATAIKNSIVANSSGSAALCVNVTDGGTNLHYNGTCVATFTTADPLLSALADNGGPTQTMALQAGSPAIDTGTTGTCLATDQRGVTRPINGGISLSCDMGVYEYEDLSQTVTIHPSGLASEGAGNFAPNFGYAWDNAMDSNDGDTSYVWSSGTSSTFYADMDDPAIGGGATINSVTIKVLVKNSSTNNVNIGYKTGTATIWKGDTSVGTTYTTLTLNAPTNSDGGAWSLADLNNLKVAVSHGFFGATVCYVTEVYVEINYTP